MAKATVFYEDYARVVTPTSKNVVLEYKGESPADFTFNVDISGKNADKYSNIYQNIPTRKGKDLVITTIFITSKMQTKTVTTTIKDYFDTNNLLQEIEIKNNFIGTEDYVIDRSTVWGKNGLYAQVSDSLNNDYILAPDLKEAEINLNHSGMDYVYDNKGNDKYKISASTNMFFELNGNDGYFITNGSTSVVIDSKGNDQYDSKDSSRLDISDFVGNDKYSTEDNGIIIGADLKGNDQYELYSNERSEIHDLYGQDKYYIKYSRPTNSASGHQLTDYFGNDYYEIENSWALSIKDDKGKDKYIIKNIDTSSTEITVSNFTIKDSLGNDKYELANVKSKYGQDLSSIIDNEGNDNYILNQVQYLNAIDGKGNDKYTLVDYNHNVNISDSLGKDTYKSEGDTTLSSVDITDKGTSSDTYTLNGGNLLSITDEGGNNKFTISNCYESGIEATGNGNDTYKYTNMSDCWIDDNAGDDKYTVDKCSMVFIEDIVGDDTYKFTEAVTCNITDESGNDKYNLLGTNDKNIYEIEITDKYGNDKYSFNGQIINTKIDDLSGIDTYSNNSKSELTCIHIYDKGADKDTYKLNNVEGTIEDEGGDNTFAINAGVEFYVTASGLGNDKYNFKNISYWYIKDAEGNDNYTLSKCSTGSITDNDGNDKYNIKNSSMISILDKNGDDSYSIDLTKTEGAKYYIEDWYSDDGDTLTIKGLSTKNIMYLSDYDKDSNCSGDMIIFDKSSKSYIQIDSFFNYSTEFNTIEKDFEYGQIETIKVGGKKLDIDAMEMSTYLDNISIAVGNWLSKKSYDDVCTLFDSGKEEDISNFIAYMTES